VGVMYYWLIPLPFRLWEPCSCLYWVRFNCRRFAYRCWVSIWSSVIEQG